MIEIKDTVETPRGVGVVFGTQGAEVYVVGEDFYSWFDRKDVKFVRRGDR